MTRDKIRRSLQISIKVEANKREYYFPAQERIRNAKVLGIVPITNVAYDAEGNALATNIGDYSFLTLTDSRGNTFVELMPFALIEQMVKGDTGPFWLASSEVDFAKSKITLDPNQASAGSYIIFQVIFEEAGK